MHNLLCFLTIFFAASATKGQNDLIISNDAEGKNAGVENRFCIGFSPLPLINYYDGPTNVFGAEVRLYRNVSFAARAGGFLKTKTHYWWKENAKGFVVRPELKVYLNKEGLNNGKFVSAEYMYKKQDFDFWATIKNDSVEDQLIDYHIFREQSAVNIKYGEVLSEKKQFIFEWFAGAGICFVKGRDTLTDTQRENIDSGEGQGGAAGAWIRWTGKHAQPFITTGITLSLRVF